MLRSKLFLLDVVLCVLLCSSLVVSVDAASMWSRTYGGTGNEVANSIIVTSDGGYAMAGWTESFGAGGADFWLVKTDENGVMQRNRTYGGAGDEYAHSFVETPDGGCIVAGVTDSFGAGWRDFWLVKTDEFGFVPEYSSWLVPALVLTATAFIIINKKRLLHKRS